jgi:hypothetical protein
MQKSKRKNSLFYLLLVAILLSSCSLEKRIENKFRRAERKIEKLTIKYPELLKKDTLRDTFKIFSNQIKHDTSFVSLPGDTTYVYKDKLRIKYVRVGDTTYIEGECKGDTIIRTVEIPVDKIVVRKESVIDQIVKYFKRSIIWVIILLVIAIAVRIAWKFIKPF